MSLDSRNMMVTTVQPFATVQPRQSITTHATCLWWSPQCNWFFPVCWMLFKIPAKIMQATPPSPQLYQNVPFSTASEQWLNPSKNHPELPFPNDLNCNNLTSNSPLTSQQLMPPGISRTTAVPIPRRWSDAPAAPGRQQHGAWLAMVRLTQGSTTTPKKRQKNVKVEIIIPIFRDEHLERKLKNVEWWGYDIQVYWFLYS